MVYTTKLTIHGLYDEMYEIYGLFHRLYGYSTKCVFRRNSLPIPRQLYAEHVHMGLIQIYLFIRNVHNVSHTGHIRVTFYSEHLNMAPIPNLQSPIS